MITELENTEDYQPLGMNGIAVILAEYLEEKEQNEEIKQGE